jgi:hypothetical protein
LIYLTTLLHLHVLSNAEIKAERIWIEVIMGLQKALIQQMFETEETNELSPESNVGHLEDKAVLIRRP